MAATMGLPRIGSGYIVDWAGDSGSVSLKVAARPNAAAAPAPLTMKRDFSVPAAAPAALAAGATSMNRVLRSASGAGIWAIYEDRDRNLLGSYSERSLLAGGSCSSFASFDRKQIAIRKWNKTLAGFYQTTRTRSWISLGGCPVSDGYMGWFFDRYCCFRCW